MTRLLETLAALAGLQGRGRTPKVLTYTVTFRCNARCVMCDSWRIGRQDELDAADLARIFAQLPPLDVVRLTGGEPFVREDLVDVAALAHWRLAPRLLHVTTNGFLTDRIVRFAEARDRSLPLHLLVSVDGLAAKHDEVRAVPRAYERALETLRALAPRCRELNLRLAVNQTVLDDEGARHYGPLRAEMARLGVRTHLVVAYAESATYSVERDREVGVPEGGGYATHGHFTPEALRSLLDAAQEDLAQLPRAERLAKGYYLRGLRRRLLGEAAPGGPRCVALHAHLRLFPNGDVPTCQFNSRVVGNLRDEPFERVWHGVLAAEGRRWVRACAGCWAECEVLPSAAYTGALARHAAARPLETLAAAAEPAAARDGRSSGRPLEPSRTGA